MPKSKLIAFRLDEDQGERLDSLAENHGMTRSAVVRRLIAQASEWDSPTTTIQSGRELAGAGAK